jgi:hypothetical protein
MLIRIFSYCYEILENIKSKFNLVLLNSANIKNFWDKLMQIINYIAMTFMLFLNFNYILKKIIKENRISFKLIRIIIFSIF